MLIAKGASLTERDKEGDGPMHWAAKRGDMEIFRLMANAGACPKFSGKLGYLDNSSDRIIIRNDKLVYLTLSFDYHLRSSWLQYATLRSK